MQGVPPMGKKGEKGGAPERGKGTPRRMEEEKAARPVKGEA